MNRAFCPLNRVPTGRVGLALELDCQAVSPRSLRHSNADHALGRIPRRTTWSSTVHVDGADQAINDLDTDLGRAKLFAVCTEADLPREPTSRGRCDNTIDGYLTP